MTETLTELVTKRETVTGFVRQSRVMVVCIVILKSKDKFVTETFRGLVGNYVHSTI